MKSMYFSLLSVLSLAVCAAPKSLDIQLENIKVGEVKKFSWNESVIYVHNRTDDDISRLLGNSRNNKTSYRKYVLSKVKLYGEESVRVFLEGDRVDSLGLRSLEPRWGVFSGVSPLTGCMLSFVSISGERYLEDACSSIRFGMDGLSDGEDRLPIPNYTINNGVLKIFNEPFSTKKEVLYSQEYFTLDEQLESLIWNDKTEDAAELLTANKWLAIDSKKFPLHSSVATENIVLVKLLLKYGADPEKKSVSGKSAIQLAEELKLWEIKKCLLKYKN